MSFISNKYHHKDILQKQNADEKLDIKVIKIKNIAFNLYLLFILYFERIIVTVNYLKIDCFFNGLEFSWTCIHDNFWC